MTSDEPLVERISLFMLRKRQFPGLAHAAFVVGKYYLIDKIDEGAMGIVCTALERTFGTIALKFPKLMAGPRVRDRIVREGQLLSLVHHTNVLRVYEVGQAEDTLYIATEYIEGESLRSWQAAPGRDWRALVGAYLQAGRGLAAIHARQIVHQDIKPDNIRVDRRGVVRILDFGLAHLESRMHEPDPTAPQGAEGGPHSTFYRGGTPGYMAPEQYRHGGRIDARADQFAFCAALWEALHGVLPYAADTIASSSATGQPLLGAPASDRVRAVPRWLRAILLRGLDERPEQRFPTMDALVAVVERRLSAVRWPALALGGSTGLAGAALTAWLLAPVLPLCAAPNDSFAGVWDDASARQLDLSVQAAQNPAAVPAWTGIRDALTAHRSRWWEVHAALCHQAAELGDPAVYNTRRSCLEERRDDVALVVAGVRQFAASHTGDARADWSRQCERWEQQLEPVEDCLVAQPPGASPSPAAAQALRAAQAALLGGSADAAALFERAIIAANVTGDRRRRARAHLELGRIATTELRPGAAEAHLLAGFRDAEAMGDDLRVVDAASLLLLVQGDHTDHPEAAVPWYSVAMGRLERLGLGLGPRALELEIRAAEADLHLGRHLEAEAALARAEALREQLDGHPHQRAREEEARAGLAKLRGDLTGAVTHLRAAITHLTDLYGPHAPLVADTLRSLGATLHEVGDPTAENVLLRALAIHERHGGADTLAAAAIHVELASFYYELDRPERARLHADRAGAVFDTAPSTTHRAWQASASSIRGLHDLQFTRRFDRAAAHFARGIAFAGDARSADEIFTLAGLRVGLAQAELQAGRIVAGQRVAAPLRDVLDRYEHLAVLRPNILQTFAELALASGDRRVAERDIRDALAGLTDDQRGYAPLVAELEWTLARVLGPQTLEGRDVAAHALVLLRRSPVAPTAALQPRTIESWLIPNPPPTLARSRI